MHYPALKVAFGLLLLSLSLLAFASDASTHIDLTGNWVGYTAILIFVIAYALVMAEEFTHLRKSKPVVLAASRKSQPRRIKRPVVTLPRQRHEQPRQAFR